MPGDSGGAVLSNGVLVGVHWGFKGGEVLYTDCIAIRKWLTNLNFVADLRTKA
jgi:hypothetical protein